MHSEPDDAIPLTWKKYLLVALRFLVVFYIATFCLGVLFLHRGENWLLPGLVVAALYFFIILASAFRMVRQFSMAAIMVASPTIPLCMLIIVVSLLPTLQVFDKHRGQHLPKAASTHFS